MCNHYRNLEHQMREWDAIERASFAEVETPPDADLWPRRAGYVVREAGGARMVEAMAWGVPLKVQGKRPGSSVTRHVTNVRNLASPFWRATLARPEQRCLVPFTEFSEPKAGRDEYWFSVPSRPVSAFAGIWRESEAGRVYAFLTCAPNSLVSPLHPKAMPVILDETHYDAWLDGEDAAAFAHPFPAQLMAVRE